MDGDSYSSITPLVREPNDFHCFNVTQVFIHRMWKNQDNFTNLTLNICKKKYSALLILRSWRKEHVHKDSTQSRSVKRREKKNPPALLHMFLQQYHVVMNLGMAGVSSVFNLGRLGRCSGTLLQSRTPAGRHVWTDWTNIEMSSQTKQAKRATNLAGAERKSFSPKSRGGLKRIRGLQRALT